MDNSGQNDWFSEEAATLGDRLAGAREAAGLDQAALAEQLGVQTDTVEAWENDLREPRANRLNMLSGLLGVSLRWLLTGVGEGPDIAGEAGEVPADASAILGEIRKVRTDMAKAATTLGQLEKQLRAALKTSP